MFLFEWFFVFHMLFVDRDWKNADIIASHRFWIWIKVPPSRLREGKYLVDCDACEDFKAILGVAIWWYHQMVVHNMRMVCLKVVKNMKKVWVIWWLIFPCKGSQYFLCGQLWSNQVLFQLTFQFKIWLIQFPLQLCCEHSYYQAVIQRMWQV